MSKQQSTYLSSFFRDFFPNKNDYISFILWKLFYLISLVLVITVVAAVCGKAFRDYSEQREIQASRQVLFADETFAQSAKKLSAGNSDFKAWISVPNTEIDNPVYQTDNNRFYLNHNGLKKSAANGALFLDYRDEVSFGSTDKNYVIYGKSTQTGTLFSDLIRYRQLDFYKQNPTLLYRDCDGEYVYKIFAVLILNAAKEDDGNHVFNLYKSKFDSDSDFSAWFDEAQERSVLKTGVEGNKEDKRLTLVTNCDDFPNARLVVLARRTRAWELSGVDTSLATVNEHPRYPRIWYKMRNLEYPFDTGEQ